MNGTNIAFKIAGTTIQGKLVTGLSSSRDEIILSSADDGKEDINTLGRGRRELTGEFNLLTSGTNDLNDLWEEHDESAPPTEAAFIYGGTDDGDLILSGNCLIKEMSLDDADNDRSKVTITARVTGQVTNTTVAAYSTEAQAVIDNMTGLVDAEKAAIAAFVDTLETAGVWTLIDEFVHLGLQTEANTLTHWKSGNSMTAINTPTHTPGTGITLNGSTQYLQAAHNPTIVAGNYTQDLASSGARTVTNSNTDGALFTIFGASDGTNKLRISNASGTTWRTGANDADAVNVGTDLTSGDLTSIRRWNSTNHRVYIDGVQDINSSTTSTAILNKQIFIGCYNNNGTPESYFNGVLSSWFIGGNFDHATLETALDTLDTALAAI